MTVTKIEFEAAINAHGLMIEKPTRSESDKGYLYECFEDADGQEIGFITWFGGEPAYTLR